MAAEQQNISPRTTTEITGAGAGIGVLVGFLTSDVILGVIAGAGFIGCATLLARAWTGHGGHHLSHP